MIAREEWVGAVTVARDGGAAFFDFLTAVDRGPEGFDVVLRLWDPAARTETMMLTRCPRDDARVPSLTGLFAGAGWHERAVAELFGIGFDGHDTAPLLLSPSFEGHPLRKDFVLAARVAKPWPGVKEPGESAADLSADAGAGSGAEPGAEGRPTRRRAKPLGVAEDWA